MVGNRIENRSNDGELLSVPLSFFVNFHQFQPCTNHFYKCRDVMGKLKYLTYLHSDSVVLTIFFTFPQIIDIPCRRFKLNGIWYLLKLENINWDLNEISVTCLRNGG